MDEISLENSLRIIGKSELSHENSGEVPRAANFCSKIRWVETIGVAKMRRNITENLFQRIFIEKPGNSSKFVCITFAQYCTCNRGIFPPLASSRSRYANSELKLCS